jgi:type IV pilus assembly protein PilB
LSLKNSERTENKSIIELVDRLLSEAIDEKASDIHFEPMPDEYRIRFRIDGILYNRNHLKSSLALQVVSRLKVISKLDIAERRLPQDGRFTIYGKNNEKYDCRISSCPTFFGEKIVVRIPSVTNCLLSFSALGMNEQQKLLFEQYIHKPQGMIIVTGPTGSGKTLTLLSALSVLNVEAKNISTAEDPIELNLPGINQVEVNTKIGLTFSSLLRAFLRQDPDIIMLGEIRDLEAAEIAVQAAETGHLVLSTLHTNSAAEAVSRLLNMGIVPMNIANSVILIIAQRLVRKLCESCKQPEESAAFLLHRFDTSLNFTECPPIFRAVGCKRCKNGYLGRVGVFEILPISKNISYMIMQNKNAADILQEACSLGMLTLKNAALKKVFAGVTSIDEVARVIMQ